MAALEVTTTPQQVPGNWQAIQNEGPAYVWIGTDSMVNPLTGYRLPTNQSFKRPVTDVDATVWVVTREGTADLRVHV